MIYDKSFSPESHFSLDKTINNRIIIIKDHVRYPPDVLNDMIITEVMTLKRMISYMAALAILTSVSAPALFPAVQSSCAVTASAAGEVSLKELAGKWRLENGDGGYTPDVCAVTLGILEVKEDGACSFTTAAGKKVAGKAAAGVEKYSDGQEVPTVTFSDESGALDISGYYNGDIISIGNGGRQRLVRVTTGDASADAVIEQRMNDLSLIIGVLSGTLPGDIEDIVWNGNVSYRRVTDLFSIGSLEEFRALIEKTCTGDLMKRFLEDYDGYFLEKDGKLYCRYNNSGHVIFDISAGVIISDKTADSFKATTVKDNMSTDYSQAVFSRSEDGSWRIISYNNGVFSVNTSVDDRTYAATLAVAGLGLVLEEFAKGGPKSAETITVNGKEYIKSKNQNVDPERVESIIKESCTGELRDSLVSICKENYIIRDGVLYNLNSPKGVPDFDFSSGFTLLSAEPDSCKVVTNHKSQLYGYTIFEMKAADGRWLISSYSFSPFPQEKLFSGYVALDDGVLNLRAEPDVGSDILAGIPNGTQLEIYKSGTNGWYMVGYDGKTGYVSADFIKEIPSSGVGVALPGDLTGDGAVDSSDASEVLAVYANGATGGTVTDETKSIGDINKDGLVDSSDASLILEYYAYVSTGGAETPATYFAKKS